MAYLRIDDHVSHHQKHLTAGPAASWLWLCGIAYCQRHLTDGFIPAVALSTLGVPEWRRLTPILVNVNLWERAEDGGYRVHDFLKHNDSAATRRQKTAERNERVTRYRDARKQNGNALPSEHGNAPPTPPPLPSPTPQPVQQQPRAFDRQHAKHVHGFCDWVCFPEFLFQEFAGKCSGGMGTVDAWAKTIKRQWQGRDVGDSLQFWRARWAERATVAAHSEVPDIEETRRRLAR